MHSLKTKTYMEGSRRGLRYLNVPAWNVHSATLRDDVVQRILCRYLHFQTQHMLWRQRQGSLRTNPEIEKSVAEI